MKTNQPQHTAGPWDYTLFRQSGEAKIQANIPRSSCRTTITKILSHGDKLSDEEAANAARIVACVNACEGIADPAFYVAAMEAKAKGLTAQRDELAAALRSADELLGECYRYLSVDQQDAITEVRKVARAALAKVQP